MPDVLDGTYLNIELAIPRDEDGPDFATVTKRLRGKYGLPVSRDHNNPTLDTIMYELDYKDGHKYFLAANAIAENMFAQVNGGGNRHVLSQEIVGHRYNGTELKKQDAFIATRTGSKRRRDTMKGVKFLFKWKDGRTTWVTPII